MLTDFFDRQFFVHDIVVYPLRQGSSMWLEKAVVYDIMPDRIKIIKANGNKTYIKNYKNCIIQRN